MELNVYQSSPQIQKKKWWIIGAVSFASFVAMLGAGIVSIAVPDISHDLGVSTDWAEKLTSFFLIVLAIGSLLFGKLADKHGKKKIFIYGMVIITIGSFLCGIPVNFVFLIIGRMIQATGAAMVLSNNNAIVTEIALPTERGQALGILGSFSVVGGIIGPSIGGLIINVMRWSFLFWLLVPLGLLSILYSLKVLPKDHYLNDQRIDYWGFAMVASGFAFLYAGILVGQFSTFLRPLVYLLFGIFFVILLFFVFYERKQESPLILFSMFENKSFLVGLMTAFLIYGTSYFYTVPMPLYLQKTLGYSPATASVLFLVFPIVMAIMSPISGKLVDKYSGHTLILLGLLLLSVSQLLFLLENRHSSILLFIVDSIVLGLGMALFQIPNNTMIMSVGTSKNLSTVGSLKSAAQNLGRFLGVSFSTLILYAAMSAKAGRKVTGYVDGHPEIFLYGMRITFIVSFLLCIISLFLVIIRLWKGRTAKNQKKEK